MTQEARIYDLERRLAALETERYGASVRGWSGAARVLHVSVATVRRWFKTDVSFPAPVKVRRLERGRISPEWKLSQLTQYNPCPRSN